MIPAQNEEKMANDAYKNRNYDLAIYYYDKALAIRPVDQEDLFKRGICKLRIGNNAGACVDWGKAIQIINGNIEIGTLIEKYCK